MDGVAHAYEKGSGVAHHDDGRTAERSWRSKERKDSARRNDDHHKDDTEDQRKRLRTKRIVEHPDIAAHQGVLHPAQQESISADMQPRC
jgi:hypothetical protein